MLRTSKNCDIRLLHGNPQIRNSDSWWLQLNICAIVGDGANMQWVGAVSLLTTLPKTNRMPLVQPCREKLPW